MCHSNSSFASSRERGASGMYFVIRGSQYNAQGHPNPRGLGRRRMSSFVSRMFVMFTSMQTELPAPSSWLNLQMASCLANANFIASGCFSQSWVEPSISVKRNVTVPAGSISNYDINSLLCKCFEKKSRPQNGRRDFVTVKNKVALPWQGERIVQRMLCNRETWSEFIFVQ